MIPKCVAAALLLLALVLMPKEISGDSGILWLVNRNNRLPSDYQPTDIANYNGVKLHGTARKAFVQMLEAMKQDEIHGLRLQSAYRPYVHQQAIFNQRVKELQVQGYNQPEAEYKAAKSIQPPGASEHQLGLALDVSVDGKLTQAFAETSAGKWLETHSHNHGFIIRYPASKTEITQIVYEPWHLRYVGTSHATIMKNLDLTLEEYWVYMRQARMYIFWDEDGDYYLISYSDVLPVSLPKETICVSSIGANKNEYIITTRKTYPNAW